jgi:pimeloyl-ACP methyl ester carboxylesterase
VSQRKSLLLLPGSLCDEQLWSPQIEALSGDYEISTPELRSYDSLTQMAEVVLQDAPERFALAGFSMGGRVALEIWRRAAARVDGIALLDAGVHPVRPGEGERRQGMMDLAREQGMTALAEAWLPRTLQPSRLSDVSLVADLTRMICRFTPDDYEAEIRALLNRPDAREVVPSLNRPTLLLSGEDDPLSSPAQNRELAAQIPGAQLVIIPGCGHFAPLEAPEETTRALQQWLEASFA